MTRCWVQRLGRGTKNKNPGQFALAGAFNGAGVFWGLAPLQGKIDKMVIVADQAGHDGMTTEKILAALDKPRKLYSILMVVNPSGSLEELQQKLLKMRDEGLVKFDIHKGRWYLPN